LFTDPGAVIFNNMESIRIGGNIMYDDEIVDDFYGIIAGMIMSLSS